MDLMDLINNWKKIAGMNSPMLPGQPSQATPPFAPPSAPKPEPHPPMAAAQNPVPPKFDFANVPFPKVNAEAALPEVQVTQREKIGMDQILPEVKRQSQFKAEGLQPVEVEAEKRSGMIDKPWYKDGAFMTELGGRLGNAFGGLTLRGNSSTETMINAQKIKQAQDMRSSNKSMDFLIQNNPEMAKKLMALSPEQRAKFMPMAIAQGAGLQTGDESAFAEKVRMLEETGVPRDQAIQQVLSGSGTNINMNMGSGAKPFETKIGESAADWYSGRHVTSRENRREANRVIGDLQNAIKSGQPITGSWASYLPETLRNVVDAEGLDMQQSVERIVQQSLKETLGAQFAQKEAEQLFARTWNPKASPEVNLRRTQRLLGELDAYAANMDHITRGMFESEGSILKWLNDNPSPTGQRSASSIYDIEYDDDFDTAGVASSGPVAKPSWMSQEDWNLLTPDEQANPIWQQ